MGTCEGLKMYRVEMIPKTSTNLDIIGPWTDSGRVDNSADGEYVFEQAEVVTVNNGVVFVSSRHNSYWYNLSDFYRVKAIKLGDNGQLEL